MVATGFETYQDAFQSPLGEVVKETQGCAKDSAHQGLWFQSPLGEVVKETDDLLLIRGPGNIVFQSPLGEVVKETRLSGLSLALILAFQSPLGEVVKETCLRFHYIADADSEKVSIPSRGSGKGDSYPTRRPVCCFSVSIPSRGSGKGDLMIVSVATD